MGMLDLTWESDNNSSSMRTFAAILVLAGASGILGNENFSGTGTFACYGDMTVTVGKDGYDDIGYLDCQPSWGSAAAPQQGIIADGDDGSHWVTVDDKGSGNCTGTFWFETGDLGLGYCNRIVTLDDGEQTRKFCGYASCTGYINLHCSMLSGCHG